MDLRPRPTLAAMVELEDLRSFVETAHQGSFTAAARLQYVTQSSLSRRIAEKFERELRIPMKKQVNNAEHVIMDVEHAHLLMNVARKYATTGVAQKAIIHGAKESLLIDRVYRGHLADMLESLA